MPSTIPLRVAVLVDLSRSPHSGGHVKCWERLGAAAAESGFPLDLTIYFSGEEATEVLGPRARFRSLPPVFSSSRLTFLPYVPDHADLASHHRSLAGELRRFDVIHTTGGFFAFARTAERISRAHGIPLVTSLHTDTPAYSRIFTRQTIEANLGTGWLSRKMVHNWELPERQGRVMDRKLRRHLALCNTILVTREEDRILAAGILGETRVKRLRLGVDKRFFGPHRADRAGVERDYRIPPGRILALFVGRIDAGKNIHTLASAIARCVEEGVPLHLITAGQGPLMEDVKKRLGGNATTPGFVAPEELARLYASADCLALCSEVEIRSMAGVEALASSCPVLASRRGGVAGLFNTAAVQAVESDQWAEALRLFASDPARRQCMRAAALEYRNRLSGWNHVLEDLYAVWQKAAETASSEASTEARLWPNPSARRARSR